MQLWLLDPHRVLLNKPKRKCFSVYLHEELAYLPARRESDPLQPKCRAFPRGIPDQARAEPSSGVGTRLDTPSLRRDLNQRRGIRNEVEKNGTYGMAVQYEGSQRS